MKKFILTLLLIVCVSVIAEAKIYVCLDKSTGEPQGVASLKPEMIADWAENFIMIEADDSYRGLQGYEIKYKDQKLRKAMQSEIDAYNLEQENETKLKQKEKALEILGLNEEDLDKIKKLPKE